jgi:hypothetical protein
MAPLLNQNDHYILKKLCDELLPWMICGRRVKDQWFVRLAGVYRYTGDLAAALAGLGIGAPLAALAAGKAPAGKGAMDILRDTLPGAWFYVGLAALLVWVVIRLVIQNEDVISRALLARDCAQSMKALKVELWKALPDSAPMPKITIVQKSVDDKVQTAVNNKVWPMSWDPLPPADQIAEELRTTVEEIRTKFMSHWSPAPPGAV